MKNQDSSREPRKKYGFTEKNLSFCSGCTEYSRSKKCSAWVTFHNINAFLYSLGNSGKRPFQQASSRLLYFAELFLLPVSYFPQNCFKEKRVSVNTKISNCGGFIKINLIVVFIGLKAKHCYFFTFIILMLPAKQYQLCYIKGCIEIFLRIILYSIFINIRR